MLRALHQTPLRNTFSNNTSPHGRTHRGYKVGFHQGETNDNVDRDEAHTGSDNMVDNTFHEDDFSLLSLAIAVVTVVMIMVAAGLFLCCYCCSSPHVQFSSEDLIERGYYCYYSVGEVPMEHFYYSIQQQRL